MKFLHLIIVLTISLIASACASTGVVSLGENLYYIGKKDGSPGLGVSVENKAEVYKEANAFCESKGLKLEIVEETVIPAAPARLGSTEIEFRCI
ncbi:hypothetical protein [Pseudidiomarina atlantica]|uniref:hypothetical protein n=1 Tax=Pseudidiomarina atlantica TaxID=1517416 RepID=UPI0006924BDC|nr:hypothetical protein [Pseudidiomarina atlantica]